MDRFRINLQKIISYNTCIKSKFFLLQKLAIKILMIKILSIPLFFLSSVQKAKICFLFFQFFEYFNNFVKFFSFLVLKKIYKKCTFNVLATESIGNFHHLFHKLRLWEEKYTYNNDKHLQNCSK